MPDSGIDISTVDALRENLDKEIQWMLQDSTWEMVKESLDYQHHSAIPREMLPMSM